MADLFDHNMLNCFFPLVYDASFRVPQGILTGNLAHLGNFYQCLAIRQDAEDGPIEGKYCTISMPMDADSVTLLPGLPSLPDLLPREVLEKVVARHAQAMRGARVMAGIAETTMLV